VRKREREREREKEREKRGGKLENSEKVKSALKKSKTGEVSQFLIDPVYGSLIDCN
jgi:hypothetical protein